MAQKITKGLFITFEGPEGSGKSTHAKRVSEQLLSSGYRVVRTFEPGDTFLGEKIRNILLDKDDVSVSEIAELFLFEADRAQHVKEVIVPAIQDKKIVICDRFNTATFAYQGYGLGLDMKKISAIDKVATGPLVPDLTVLFDVDVQTGLKRAGKTGAADKIEKRGLEFHEKVRQGYLDLAGKDPDRIKVIQVKESIEETYSLVEREVYDIVQRYKVSE
jgi:dTMP kinase